MTYARARLWLGITCVGSIVAAAATALATGVPGRAFATAPSSVGVALAQLAAFVAAYVLLHLPFDVLGGHVLPRRFGRRHVESPAFARRLLRGALAHGFLLLAALALVHLGGRWLGMPGVVIAVGVAATLLLGGRMGIARAVAGTGATGDIGGDEGFTGGITGIVRPRGVLVPRRWARDLGDAGVSLVARRRELAVRTGAWWRGRVAALAFVLAGATLAALRIGGEASGTVAGTVAVSLWFTLWSFLGLLVLPTPSRAAVLAVDRALDATLPDAASRAAAAETLRRLERLADDEPARGAGLEAVFHPIPSVARRVADASGASDAPRAESRAPGWWDVARTAVYVGTGAGGLLGRAVHCNCGRPGLWVFLPSG